MSEEKENVVSSNLIDITAFEGSDEDFVEIPIPHIQTGDQIGTMFLKRVKMPIIDKYRDIRNGNGRRKGDEAGARKYLFEKTFERFEFLEPGQELNLNGHKTQIGFFLACGKLIDTVLVKYSGELFPDIDLRKS